MLQYPADGGDGMFWHKWPRSDRIVAVLVLAIGLLLYFSPLAISERYCRWMTQFETDSYLSVAEGPLDILATIDVQPGNPESHPNTVSVLIELTFSGREQQPVSDLRWMGMLPDGLLPFTDGHPLNIYLNYPWVYGSYRQLVSQLLRTRYDITAPGTQAGRVSGKLRYQTPVYVSSSHTWFHVNGEAGDLDALIEQLRLPIRLKLVHAGGCDYVQVVPRVVVEPK